LNLLCQWILQIFFYILSNRTTQNKSGAHYAVNGTETPLFRIFIYFAVYMLR
jgi:hypothetical protein